VGTRVTWLIYASRQRHTLIPILCIPSTGSKQESEQDKQVQVGAEPTSLAVTMMLPTSVAECRHPQPGAHSYRSISLAHGALNSKPADDRWDRQTDGHPTVTYTLPHILRGQRQEKAWLSLRDCSTLLDIIRPHHYMYHEMQTIATDVAWSVCLWVTSVRPAKADEPIKVPFVKWTCWVQACIRWEPRSPAERGTSVGYTLACPNFPSVDSQYTQPHLSEGSSNAAPGCHSAVATCLDVSLHTDVK